MVKNPLQFRSHGRCRFDPWVRKTPGEGNGIYIIYFNISILKNKGITLQTNIHIVKAMVFPVIMYGCEIWTIKKTQHQRIDAFEL